MCNICPLRKQTHKSINRSVIKTTDSFQLVHVDLWGPMKFATRLRCRSFFTIVDDYSRYT